MHNLTTIKNFYDLMRSTVIERYKYESKKFIDFIEANNHGFSLETLESWKTHLISKSYKARTINKYLLVAKGCFKRILEVNKENLTQHQHEQVEKALNNLKRIKEPANSEVCNKILTEDEVKTLLDMCEVYNPEISLMIEFMWRTGLRVSEMLGITLKDCKYIGSGTYSVRVLGKGSKERTTWIEQDFYNLVKNFFGSSTLLFKRNGKRPRSRSYVSMNIKRMAARFIDRHNVSAHILRHSFATHSLEQGMSLEWVRQALGHSDIQITARYYSHITIKPTQVIQVARLDRERKLAA